MSDSFFKVLKNDYKDLEQLGEIINNNIYINPDFAILNSRDFIDKLLNIIAEKENLQYIIQLNQFEKIKYLSKEGIINDKISEDFDYIRIISHKVSNKKNLDDIQKAIIIHRKLYCIIKWFAESYNINCVETIPNYCLPELCNVEDEIDDILLRKIKRYIEYINRSNRLLTRGVSKFAKTLEEEKIERKIMDILGYEYEEDILKEDEEEIDGRLNIDSQVNNQKNTYEYKYKKFRGSYLLNELYKLSESSKESIESCDGLDVFKKYLHIKRSIQDKLIDELKEASKSSESQLILLAGNVGDGKSHLIAYLNEEYPELVSNFSIHNDATESFDKNLTEIQTLEKVLEPFSDENLDTSNKKMILAINLGVLNNFIEDKTVGLKFQKLISFINKTKIFDQDTISENYNGENFRLISFSDYNIFKLTKEGPKSDYLEEIFKRIVNKVPNNPFYIAYLKDIEQGFVSPIIKNYELLCRESVYKTVSDLIIKLIVKNKKILSTREVLNFIYELIVPANFEEYNMSSSSVDFLPALLPNILFSSTEKGLILKEISKDDPLKIRNKELDQILVKLNMSDNLIDVLKEYIDDDNIIDLIVGENLNLFSIQNNTKQKVINTIIRFIFILGKDNVKMIFKDEIYDKYMKYLYFYNNGQFKSYKGLFEEVKSAVYNWNASPKNNYVYLNEKLDMFNVAERLNIKASSKYAIKIKNEEEIERFRNTIVLGFSVEPMQEVERIEIDYELYKKLVDINKGYYPSKVDREEAVVFVEFVNLLILKGSMSSELLIEDKQDNKKFALKYNDEFGEDFCFERIDD